MTYTINGSFTSGFTLTNANDNPVSVTSTTVINSLGDDIDGSAGIAWTIATDGTLTSLGRGIYLADGGSVTNGASNTAASISGKWNGVQISGTTGSVTNLGSISSARGNAVALYAGGGLTNGSSTNTAASLAAFGNGVFIGGATGTVTNFGSITSVRAEAVELATGGAVTNGSSADTAASIRGADFGVAVNAAAGTVTNFGTITAAHFDGVWLALGGTVVNGSATDALAGIPGALGRAGAECRRQDQQFRHPDRGGLRRRCAV